MTIAAILRGKGQDVISVRPDQPVREAIALLAERRIGAVPVMEGEAVSGIFSERDVIYCLKEGDTTVLDRSVGEVMTAPALTVTRCRGDAGLYPAGVIGRQLSTDEEVVAWARAR